MKSLRSINLVNQGDGSMIDVLTPDSQTGDGSVSFSVTMRKDTEPSPVWIY